MASPVPRANGDVVGLGRDSLPHEAEFAITFAQVDGVAELLVPYADRLGSDGGSAIETGLD